jgi:subtilisin family serine protease
VDVLVPAPGRGYKLSSGTSLAAAHVTGILALAMQRRPDLTPDEARQILAEGAKDLGAAGPDAEFGAGLADARRSVDSASLMAARARQVATVPVVPWGEVFSATVEPSPPSPRQREVSKRRRWTRFPMRS